MQRTHMDFEKEKNKVKQRLKKDLQKKKKENVFLFYLILGILLLNISKLIDMFFIVTGSTQTETVELIKGTISLLSTVGGFTCFTKMFFCLSGIKQKSINVETNIKLREREISYYLSLYEDFKKDLLFKKFVKETVNNLSTKKLQKLYDLKDKKLDLSLALIIKENEIKTKKEIKKLEQEKEKINKKIIDNKEKIGIRDIEYNIDND